jgi:poly(3-hydroxybutyrate) depolymerase
MNRSSFDRPLADNSSGTNNSRADQPLLLASVDQANSGLGMLDASINGAPSAATPTGMHHGNYHFKTVVDHRSREYSVHVPRGYDGHSPLPVMFMLPGVDGSIQSLRSSTQMDRYADRRHFAVVYLQTLSKDFEGLMSFNSWNLEHGTLSRKVAGYDDLRYVKAVHDRLGKMLSLNPEQEYLVGHSEGGVAAQYIMQKLPFFTGFASVHGTRRVTDPAPRHGHGAALLILARNDAMLPLEGGHGDVVTVVGAPLVEESRPLLQKEVWAKANMCGTPKVYHQNGDQITDYHCKSGPVREIIQWNAEHPWNAPVDSKVVVDFLFPYRKPVVTPAEPPLPPKVER